ncbi:hypothetical protein BK796_22930 [Kosakonia pseudosacchari]|uniref:Uncharacterized protein n=1 Tax=Kosakonia pseudosacchari TaxID=1646340 RepID=A0ABX4II88_9ENTR|nr:hypothetical protein BK796_22930 [Kosakonia pseudosacchari]
MTQCARRGHHLMPFLYAFEPEPGSSVILFVIIIAETGSEEGVSPNLARAFRFGCLAYAGQKCLSEFL